MDKRGWSLMVLVLLAGVSVLLFGAKPAAAAVPDGFDDKFVTSVQRPTSMAFTPDGRMLVSTQPGVLRLRKNGATSTSPALDISGKICSNSERGMLGVAVDPNFSSNHYVYIYYTFKKHGVCPTGQPTNGKNPVNRVSRFIMSGDTISKSSEKVLIDNIPSPNGNHNGGDIHFGKDGYLYISVGDGGSDYKGDSGGGGGNDAARDRNVLLGKILRVTRDGMIPSTNPYTGTDSARCGIPSANGRTASGKNCKETFARGLRNPFRMGFDPDASGTRFFINDVGQKAWEEIDRGKKAADYAWNLCEGRYDNPDRPGSVDCGSAPYTPPLHNYSHRSGCSSVTGAAFVPDAVWPAAYNKSYLFGDYVCGKIFKLTPKSGGGYSKTAFATGLGRGGPVAMTFGPSGRTLYYTTYAGGDGGQIRAISYTRGNRPPTAEVKIAGDGQNYGPLDKEYQFTGEDSTVPDGDQLTYEWSFGDGEPTATGSTTSHTYSTAGKQNVTLTVRDDTGGMDSTTVEVFAGNTAPPEPKIEAPSETLRFKVGQKITLRGSATDADDGSVPDSELSWEVRRYHGGSHYHPYFSGTGDGRSFTAPPPEGLLATNPRGNFLQVRLTATDEQGLSKTVSQRISPKTSRVRFASRPRGMKLVVNGAKFKAPRSFLSWERYKLNVVAPRRQGKNGKKFVFRRWSDGRARKHTIVTPVDAKIYVAKYKRRR
jgi:glucose/arabinose dehydrogenase